MSEIKTVVEVRPFGGTVDETLVSVGHKCAYCSGNGYITRQIDRAPGEMRVACPVCDGTGKVDAEIRIRWKASTNG